VISFEVRNSRTGTLVRTFGDAKTAVEWATAHSSVLGTLAAYAVETIRRERLLTAEPEIAAARTLRKAVR
jgi:hypothetical protein